MLESVFPLPFVDDIIISCQKLHYAISVSLVLDKIARVNILPWRIIISPTVFLPLT